MCFIKRENFDPELGRGNVVRWEEHQVGVWRLKSGLCDLGKVT
jgi:hypothetical protein